MTDRKYPFGTLIEGERVCDTCGENVHMYQIDLDWFIWYVCSPCWVSFLFECQQDTGSIITRYYAD
jgi:hypothetical protein